MIAVADSSVLLHLFDPHCAPPIDGNGRKIDRCNERIEALVSRLSKAGDVLVIPTPVLAEILTQAGKAGAVWLGKIEGKRVLRVEPFDQRAAVECAAMAFERKTRNKSVTRTVAKFDEQIVAIARVVGATEIYSDDAYIRELAGSELSVIGIGDLPLPSPPPQPDMFSQG